MPANISIRSSEHWYTRNGSSADARLFFFVKYRAFQLSASIRKGVVNVIPPYCEYRSDSVRHFGPRAQFHCTAWHRLSLDHIFIDSINEERWNAEKGTFSTANTNASTLGLVEGWVVFGFFGVRYLVFRFGFKFRIGSSSVPNPRGPSPSWNFKSYH